jgi:EXLDI family protein
MMPNRTIYVAEADLPIFEEAQQLAGDTLSATIAQALRRFVAARKAQESGFQDVTVHVGTVASTAKRFTGRLLAKGHIGGRSDPLRTSYEVFQTIKGRFALHRKQGPNWAYVPRKGWADPDADWSPWSGGGREASLTVYDTVEDLRPHIPDELYEAVCHSLRDDPVDVLDI